MNPEENLSALTETHKAKFAKSDFARNLDRINPDASINGLKYFKESDFHRVCGLREEISTVGEQIEDDTEGHGFKIGDRVEFGVFNIGSYSDDKAIGKVSGIRGAFVRVGIELFHPSRLRKL